MKVLIVASKFPPEYTGPGVRLPRLYKAIGAELGIKRIDVLTSGLEYTKNETYEFENMQVTRRCCDGALRSLPPKIKYFIDTAIADNTLKSYETDYDLVHIIGNSGVTAAALNWCKKHNIPVFMELVTAEARPVQRYYFSKTAPHKNAKIIALTQKVERACLDMGFSPAQIWCRPNPIDDSIYTPPSPEEKTKHRTELTPFKDTEIVIGSVAKMMPQKNQRLLVETMVHLPENYKLVIAGPLVKEGPLYERDKNYVEGMRAFIDQHHLNARIQMVTDFVKSADYMKACDIYALPAWNEGFGTPMIEAIACALPVIANQDEIAFQEWIKNGTNGYLCDIKKPEEWAAAIEKASRIPKEIRLAQSQKIHGAAGQKMIYKQYVEIINELKTVRKPDA